MMGIRISIIFALLFAVTSTYAEKPNRVGCPAAVKGLIEASFLDATQYSRPFLKRLKPQVDKTFLRRINLDASDDALRRLARQFPLPSKNLSVQFYAMKDSGDSDPHFVLLGIFNTHSQDSPVGYFAVKIKFEGDRLQSEIDGVYFDETIIQSSGKAEAILKFLSGSLYSIVPVQKEVLKADYAGRYVWAKLGFKFHPTYWFKDVDGGKAIKLVELARKNLQRFLKTYNVGIGDLRLNGKPVASLDQLTSPDQFAGLYHKDGKTILVRPLIGYRTFGPEQRMPTGKAFMLSDYTSQEGQPFVVSRARTKFSPTAMSYWNGFREINH